MKRHSIPGKVHQEAWKNFGHNRTRSVELAKETLEELGVNLPNCYHLLLDADMILKIEPSFNKEMLKEDAYMLVQKSSSISYSNVRLLRGDMPWICVGPTHEYWSCKVPHKNYGFNALWIDDREDGGAKADKFERDVRLLLQGLEEEPRNPRYYFYLGQSYKCLQRYDESIQAYQTRIEIGGWNEEVYYSHYMIAECYENQGKWDQALIWYLKAYQYHPSRAEPLYRIANHYRKAGENHLAYLFAKQGSSVPYPKDQVLFISDSVYHYQFDEELSISAFYTPFKEEGFDAANRLILNKKAPNSVKDLAHRNICFYVKNLSPTEIKPIQFDFPLIAEGGRERYYPMNPSIQKNPNGYTVLCRTVNFDQNGGANYHSRDPLDSTIRTRNFILEYDKAFNLLSQREITENFSSRTVRVQGLEDCRLFSFQGAHWFFCTTTGLHPGNVGQNLCKLEDNPKKPGVIEVEKFITLMGPNPNRCEKNWLPLVKDEELLFVYNYAPFSIYKVDPKNGTWKNVIEDELSLDFSRFRGSAAPIPFDDGYLMLVHEVVFKNERDYFHRFVYLDKNLKPTKLSKMFTFQHQGIEYSCGMTIDHTGKKCIIPIGYEDRAAFLVTVDLETIRSMLEPINP